MPSERYLKYEKPRREWYIQHGICPVCGVREASESRQTCLLCMDTENARTRVCYQNRTPEQKARYKKQQKEYRQKLAEQGLCRQCGQRPVASGRKKCMVCLQKERQYKKQKNNQRHLPQELRGNGLYCYWCCRPLCNGEKLCPECREKARNNLQKIQHDNSNHIWRKLEAARIAEVNISMGGDNGCDTAYRTKAVKIK